MSKLIDDAVKAGLPEVEIEALKAAEAEQRSEDDAKKALAAEADEDETEEAEAVAAAAEAGKTTDGGEGAATTEEQAQGEEEEEEEEDDDAALAEERTRRIIAETENEKLRKAAEKKEEPAPAAPAFDLKAKRREANNALIEGDVDKAEKIQEEIDAHVMSQAKKQAKEEADKEFRAELERRDSEAAQKLVDAAAAEVLKEYPFFDDRTKDANKVAIAAFLGVRNQLLKDKVPAADAIRQAAASIGPMFKKATTTAPANETAEQKAAREKAEAEAAAARKLRAEGKSPREVPKTLASVPAAAPASTGDDELTEINNLSGEDLERHLAGMSKTKVQGLLRRTS